MLPFTFIYPLTSLLSQFHRLVSSARVSPSDNSTFVPSKIFISRPITSLTRAASFTWDSHYAAVLASSFLVHVHPNPFLIAPSPPASPSRVNRLSSPCSRSLLRRRASFAPLSSPTPPSSALLTVRLIRPPPFAPLALSCLSSGHPL